MFSNFFNFIAIFVSVSTATTVLLHDMRLDKLAQIALTLPTSSYEMDNKQASFESDLHVRTEHESLLQTVQDLKSGNPQIQPRLSEDKKHLLQKRIMRGYHPFDGYNIPIQ